MIIAFSSFHFAQYARSMNRVSMDPSGARRPNGLTDSGGRRSRHEQTEKLELELDGRGSKTLEGNRPTGTAALNPGQLLTAVPAEASAHAALNAQLQAEHTLTHIHHPHLPIYLQPVHL